MCFIKQFFNLIGQAAFHNGTVTVHCLYQPGMFAWFFYLCVKCFSLLALKSCDSVTVSSLTPRQCLVPLVPLLFSPSTDSESFIWCPWTSDPFPDSTLYPPFQLFSSSVWNFLEHYLTKSFQQAADNSQIRTLSLKLLSSVCVCVGLLS